MRRVSWDEFERMSKELAERVKGKVDVVVGILRGGYFPAHMIAETLGLEVYVIRYKSYVKTRKVGKPILVLPLIGDVSGKRVLLVDDICDTGDTIKAAKELLKQYNPSDVKVATLFIKPSCEEVPEFWIEKSDEWVEFPWEKV